MKNKILFWQVVFYSSLSVLALWLILKSIGVIHTPFWLEYGVPVASTIFTFLGLYHNIIDNIKQLAIAVAHIEKDVDFLKKDSELVKIDINSLKTDVSLLKIDVGTLKTDVHLLKRRITA